MKSRIYTIIIAVVALGLVASACAKKDDSGGTPSAEASASASAAASIQVEATTANEAPKATDTPAPTPTTEATNEKKIGDLDIVVNSVAPYTSDNQFMQPDAGKAYWAVDVTATNTGDKSYDLNPLNFKLTDSEKYSNTMAITDGPQPLLSAVTLGAGETTRAFIVFSVKEGATPTGLRYQSFTGKSGTVGLPAASGS